jgi:CRP/FNR family cyclic AMP-dependent transcriptional regulator
MIIVKIPSCETHGTGGVDPKSFLAKVGEGRSIGRYRKDEIVFSQGDPADAVFYIERGEVKITVVSEQGKEAVVAMLKGA